MTIQTSLQLFTIREQLEADLEGTLAAVAARGFTAVEPYDFVRRAEAMAAAVSAAGLTAPSGHAFLATPTFVRPDGSGTTAPVPPPAEVFAAAKTLGMDTVIDPYTEPARWESVDQIVETARLLNEAAEIGTEAGVRVGYHNHAHELEAVFDGVTGLEFLAEHLDERVVLEVDLYWVARGGVDPVALVERLGERVIAVHAKDGTLDPALLDAYPPADQVPAGDGTVPLVAAIEAAPALELAIVEFDHYDGDLFDAIERSREFLDAKVAG